MSLFKAVVSFEADSGLPEDAVQNTWHFQIANDNDILWPTDVLANLEEFYTGNVAPAGFSLRNYLSEKLTGDVTVRFYRLLDPEPRVPFVTGSFTYVPFESQAIPSEVALCLSYFRAFASGEPPARAKGRLFIGPLNIEAVSDVDDVDLPSSTFIGTLAGAASRMRANSDAAGRFDWVQRSETADASGPVIGGWVDNAWDTQRRRGRAATARTTWS